MLQIQKIAGFSFILTLSVLTGLFAGNRPNIVFILSDDHRFDFMGFTGKVPWLEERGGMQIPLKRTVKYRFGDHRNENVY